eukprot:COSAG01_NODE_9494_length_2431_cov_40.723842_1_plen_305_part_00
MSSKVMSTSPVFDLDELASPRRRGRHRYSGGHSPSHARAKLQNLAAAFPLHSYSELRCALRQCDWHAGQARQMLRTHEEGQLGRASCPSTRGGAAASSIPAYIKVEGLRHIGAKANGMYFCTLLSPEAQRMCLPSIVYEKEGGGGVLLYDTGMWSIAPSVAAEDSFAYAEVATANPCGVPRSAWLASNGVTWTAAPTRFRVAAVNSESDSDDGSDSDDDGYVGVWNTGESAIGDLQRDIAELLCVTVPRQHVHDKLSAMMMTAQAAERERLDLEESVARLRPRVRARSPGGAHRRAVTRNLWPS